MKAKDYFVKLKEQGKINLEDYDKFTESLPDFEIPEAVEKAISGSFMTVDRAKTDTILRKHFHRELYDAIDAKIHESLPSFDVFDAQAIQNETDTFKKLGMVKSAIDKKIEKVSKANPDEGAKLKQLKEQNEELLAKFTAKDSEWQGKLDANNKTWESKLSDYKLDRELSDKIMKFDFADGIDKEAYTRLIKMDLLSNNTLALSENGQISVLEKVDGVAKPKFDGNDPVTIDKLLEARVKPFLKKNNANEGGEATQQSQQTTIVKPVNNGTARPVRSVAVQ